jgi:hypothetical protein
LQGQGSTAFIRSSKPRAKRIQDLREGEGDWSFLVLFQDLF